MVDLKILEDSQPGEAATGSTSGVSDFQPKKLKSRKETQSSQKRGSSVAGNQVNFVWSKSNKAMKVSLGMENGEYVLKLNTGMTDQAQTAAILSSQAAMLRRLGETLIFLSKVLKSLG